MKEKVLNEGIILNNKYINTTEINIH